MDALLNLQTQALAYDDTTANNAPERVFFAWTRKFVARPIKNPLAASYTVPPNSTLSVFSGVRSTSIDNTTQLTLSLSPVLDPLGLASTYRFTHSGGTAPAFRTNRNLTLNTRTVVVTLNANNTVTMTTQAGDWSAVQVGDWVFLPGLGTGDSASPFNDLNIGYWTVLGKAGDGSSVTLVRMPGAIFSATAESVAVTSNAQVQAFSAAGVQVGDIVDISAGFSAPLQRAFKITNVNPEWFEVSSTAALPTAEVATPTTSGIVFYSSAKNFVRVEMDQEGAVRANGAAADYDRVSPTTAGDKAGVGWSEKWGPIWSLVLVKRSTVLMNATVITGE